MRRTLLTDALQVGRRTFVAVLLTSALFAAPFAAAQRDFAHQHPAGTPDHVHTVTSVLVVAQAATPVRASRPHARHHTALSTLSLLLPRPFVVAWYSSRAPPVAKALSSTF